MLCSDGQDAYAGFGEAQLVRKCPRRLNLTLSEVHALRIGKHYTYWAAAGDDGLYTEIFSCNAPVYLRVAPGIILQVIDFNDIYYFFRHDALQKTMPTILDPAAPTSELPMVFAEVDAALSASEAAITRGEALPLIETIDTAITLTRRLVTAYLVAGGQKSPPDEDAEFLDVFKVLVKGDPTWNAIRDNCRELVYYRNCINMGRRDALPKVPEKMAVRTARHVYLYIKTRCIREGRLAD